MQEKHEESLVRRGLYKVHKVPVHLQSMVVIMWSDVYDMKDERQITLVDIRKSKFQKKY